MDSTSVANVRGPTAAFLNAVMTLQLEYEPVIFLTNSATLSSIIQLFYGD